MRHKKLSPYQRFLKKLERKEREVKRAKLDNFITIIQDVISDNNNSNTNKEK